jgi:cysteine desulfurase
MQSDFIYLDYNASTPVHPQVLEPMMPWFGKQFANPASVSHSAGRMAAEAIEIAREQIAQSIGAETSEVIFTSGATESINLAIQGLWEVFKTKRNKIIAVQTEHLAVLDVLSNLKNKGLETDFFPVDKEGRIDIREFGKRLNDSVLAVCIMAANNETGRLLPVDEIAKMAHEAGAFVICDATQAVGKIPFDIESSGADLVAMSAHKVYGPKGIGALYMRRRNPRVKLLPILLGGGHEKGLRAGSPAVPLIVGMGKALKLAQEELDYRASHMLKLRELTENLLSQDERFTLNAGGTDRLPNTTNFRLEGTRASELFSRLSNLACSSGSACSSALPKPSHVLIAMGLTEKQAYSSIRISTGIETRADEIELAIRLILGKTNR